MLLVLQSCRDRESLVETEFGVKAHGIGSLLERLGRGLRGNQPGTNDTAFNAFGLLNTGLSFAPSVSNLMMLRTGVSTFPLSHVYRMRNLQVGMDVFVYGKTDADAPIDEVTGDERYLGWEPDFFLNFPITSDVTLAVRYGVFFPNSSNFPDDDARQFIYLGVTYGF